MSSGPAACSTRSFRCRPILPRSSGRSSALGSSSRYASPPTAARAASTMAAWLTGHHAPAPGTLRPGDRVHLHRSVTPLGRWPRTFVGASEPGAHVRVRVPRPRRIRSQRKRSDQRQTGHSASPRSRGLPALPGRGGLGRGLHVTEEFGQGGGVAGIDTPLKPRVAAPLADRRAPRRSQPHPTLVTSGLDRLGNHLMESPARRR
jgi:hypothetical protein